MRILSPGVIAVAAALGALPLVSSGQVSTLANSFGVMPAKAWLSGNPVGVPAAYKVTATRNLGVPYLRHSFDHIETMTNYAGAYTNYGNYTNDGAKVLLNFNWMGGPGSHFPTGSDLTTFTTVLEDLLTDMETDGLTKPEMLVIENEESNTSYFAVGVSRDDYLDELAACIPIAHAHGVPITNAGLLEIPLNLFVWDYYYRVLGDKPRAWAFKNVAIPNAFTSYPDENGPAVLTTIRQQQLDLMLLLINGDGTHVGLKDLDLDYINVHWYLDDVETDVLEELDVEKEGVDLLRQLTGKEVICNEMGARTAGESDPLPTNAISTIMDYFQHTLKLPYVIWYSGPGDTLFPVALTTNTGVLTSYGNEYRDYIETNFDDVFQNVYWQGVSGDTPSTPLALGAQPASVVGSSGSFTATVGSGATQKWLYEWYQKGNDTPVNTPAATTSLTGGSGTVSSAGTYFAYVTNPAGAVTTDDVYLWNAVKIGGDSAATAGNPSSGTYTISGKGGALSGTSDVCQFVELPVTAPVTIVAKIAYSGTPPASARMGLMLRAGPAANAPCVLIGNTPVQARLQYRSMIGGNTTNVNGGVVATWVKLEWAANGDIKGYYSTSAGSTPPTSWTQLGTTQTFGVSTPLIGMTVNGGSPSATATGTFSSVTVK